MMTWLREKFGSILVTGIIALVGFVFVFFGLVSPKSTRGLHEGAVAGTVNGDSVSIAEFNREYNRRIEMFRGMAGGKITEEQLKQFKIKERVFQELANRKLMIQEAKNMGMISSDEEIKDRVMEIEAFKKDGRFDLITYRKVLESNNYTPGSFERMMREDLAVQKWSDYFRRRARVTDAEIKRHFIASGDKRMLKYVQITTEAAKKGITIDPKAIDAYLADSGKLAIAKSQFELRKARDFAGKDFESAKREVARDLLASEKIEEVQKLIGSLADQVVPLLQGDAANDAKINSLLKPYGATVKKTAWLGNESGYLAGIGESKELSNDAFKAKSPIDAKNGGTAKKYTSAGWTVVALVVDSQRADLSELEKSREAILRQLVYRKEQEMMSEWMRKVQSKAKIETNAAVIGS